LPFSATVFNVLIASPSDVPTERDAIAKSLHEWNSLNAKETGKVLLPVMWESHSAPAMGGRPQEIINEQVVRSCDMLIGAFWTRLGSPTGVEDSGTVEEIKWFLENNKLVMLYYSKAHVDVDNIETSQLDKLKEFKKSIRNKGIQEQYSSISELKEKLSRQLTIHMREMSGVPITSSVVKEARSSANEKFVGIPVHIQTEDKTQTTVVAEKIWFEDYSEKSFSVRGNTIDKKDELKKLGGNFIAFKTGGKGWNFSKKRLAEVADLFGVEAELR
jgi:hypothetical protein